MTDVETAQRLRNEAKLAVSAARERWEKAKKAALAGVEIAHAPIVKAAENVLRDAERVLAETTDAATPDHEWEGRRVFRMVPGGGRAWNPRPDVREEGIVETVRQGSRFANNLSTYSTPRVGDVIVRSLKKDGSRALKFDRLGSSYRPWSLVVSPTPSEAS